MHDQRETFQLRGAPKACRCDPTPCTQPKLDNIFSTQVLAISTVKQLLLYP